MTEATVPLYTIGYGNRTPANFMQALRQHEIRYLVDVRSKPISRFNPFFTSERLKRTLITAGIHYVFMGDTLGGRPDDDSCYSDGKVDYQKCQEKEWYRTGIARLQRAWQKQCRVAIMCSEAKPQDCHRTKLIGQTLTAQNIPVAHIDETDQLKTQNEVLRLLLGPQASLWNPVLTSRKRYRSPEVAYQEAGRA